MDANQTRFHLVFGKQDWPAGDDAGSPPGKTEWRNADATIALRRRLLLYPAPPSGALSMESRRGAARDRYGNSYWIGENKAELLFLGHGRTAAEHFWSPADELFPCGSEAGRGAFTPAGGPRQPRTIAMGGLAVTAEHYLVAGLVQPRGLLIFDLHAGGPPVEVKWPSQVEFEPFDMAAAPGGGVFILDRRNRRYWALDRFFRVIAPGPAGSPNGPRTPDFIPLEPSPKPAAMPERPPGRISVAMAFAVAAADPIAIEPLPDGTALILDSPRERGYSAVFRYRFGVQLGPDVAFDALQVEPDAPVPRTYRLLGQDLAFVPGPPQEAGRLAGTVYVADSAGSQVFSFELAAGPGELGLELQPDYLPMRRFGGRALVASGDAVFYDFDSRWTQLAIQPRPQHETEAALVLPLTGSFDGKMPGCAWHRLLLDACIPPGAGIRVESRAGDHPDLLNGAPWVPEPRPYLRRGSEIPFYRPRIEAPPEHTGTWELLLQRARGRYLQVRLALNGTGRNSPRIQALRVYYPRFSYLNQYLPSLYREDESSAWFLDRFLANVEGLFTELEDKIANAQVLFDSRTAPAEFLDWLAGWLGTRLDLAWDEPTRRFFIANAIRMFRSRGTPEAIVRAIRLALEKCPGEHLFESGARPGFTVRIVEHFLLRRGPGVLFGDPGDVVGPGSTIAASTWTPSQGAQPLHERYREYLRARYATIQALNTEWGETYAAFDDPRLIMPALPPAQPAKAADWRRFLREGLGFTYAAPSPDDEVIYREFLARRHRHAADLNRAYGLTGEAQVRNFQEVRTKLWEARLAQALPASGPFLQDWIAFVSAVLPTLRNAHRFTALIPVAITDSTETQVGRLALARRIAEHERPAHTECDVRLYWAAFRAGEARVGLETVAGLGSRSVALILGSGTLAGGHLRIPDAWAAPNRLAVVGRDKVR